MNNLRIIYDNAADRATITASSEASASLGVVNLKSDTKARVWRSTGTSATLTATWSSSETVAGAFLPFCNLTALATMRLRGFAEVADAAPLFDTGAIPACPGQIMGLWEWGGRALGSNAFAYGGGTYGRVWVPVPGAIKELVIDIEDPDNPLGYVEASRLVCGAYWSPEYNASVGASITPVDTSTHFRNAAGDLLTDAGTKHRSQVFDLSTMSASDRAMLWSIVRGNGMPKPMLFSLYPDHEDSALEQAHQMYCKLSSAKAIVTPISLRYNSTIELEEV